MFFLVCKITFKVKDKNNYIRKWKNNKEEIKKKCINEDCYDDGLQEATW